MFQCLNVFMHILLVTIDYPPEIRSVATMCRELANELSFRGHTLTVLTTWPKYNLPEAITPRQFHKDTQEGDVRVLRVKTLPLHKVNYLVRGIAQITLPYLFLRALKRHMKERQEKFDAVIVYSPPLSLATVGVWIKEQYGATFLLNVQDVFPQNAIDLGILRNKILIRYFEWVEQEAYRLAHHLTTCTEGARQFLIQRKGIAPEKVTAVYNWVDTTVHSQIQTASVSRARFGLEGKFVMVFAGIMGPSQGLEFVIEVMRRLTDLHDVVLLLLGDGTSRPHLEEMVKQYALSNVMFGNFVSPAEYPLLLKEIDVGLMALEKNCKTPTIPGKFFGFAAAARPVLAFLNPESEGHRVIKDARCGYSLVSEDPEAAAMIVRNMYAQKGIDLDHLGMNGYTYVVTHFSKEACIEKVEQILIRV